MKFRARSPIARLFTDPIVVGVALILITSAVFVAFPGIDLWASNVFYDPAHGFSLAGNTVLILLRRSSGVAMVAICVAVVVSLAVKLARPDRPSLIPPSSSILLVSTLALGPGLLVNLILKDHWGRPRPFQIEQFGGGLPYVDVWRITDYCATNCSFVSGEGSSAIWLTALALVVPPRWRLPTAIITGTYAGALSINRIAFGGHFLSDVLLSWELTLLLIAIAYRIIVERPPRWLANGKLEAALTELGARLHGGARA